MAHATGGTITTNGSKTVHTFTTVGSTTFTPDMTLSCQYLVVAGGGGGGVLGGGGGAGGMRTGTLSVSGEVTVTVGDGGAGSTDSTVKGTSGQIAF